MAIVDWSGRESRSIDEIDEANKAEAEAGVESESGRRMGARFAVGRVSVRRPRVDRVRSGLGVEARGAPEDVVVSCSFYDKGLHVWSPR